ncbi:hypothetical protein BKA83DRAFT_4129797 [Pisolithus microcarpus]|nr:hypothetical protein BKA83DRAFT_4129797 [Pisolithus microcarpus]
MLLDLLYVHQYTLVDWPVGVPAVSADFNVKCLNADELQSLTLPFLKEQMGDDYLSEVPGDDEDVDDDHLVPVPRSSFYLQDWSAGQLDVFRNADLKMFDVPLVINTYNQPLCLLSNLQAFLKALPQDMDPPSPDDAYLSSSSPLPPVMHQNTSKVIGATTGFVKKLVATSWDWSLSCPWGLPLDWQLSPGAKDHDQSLVATGHQSGPIHSLEEEQCHWDAEESAKKKLEQEVVDRVMVAQQLIEGRLRKTKWPISIMHTAPDTVAQVLDWCLGKMTALLHDLITKVDNLAKPKGKGKIKVGEVDELANEDQNESAEEAATPGWAVDNANWPPLKGA